MCGLSVHALRCALLLVSLVFGEMFFGKSPSLHYLFLHFFYIYVETHPCQCSKLPYKFNRSAKCVCRLYTLLLIQTSSWDSWVLG